MNYMYKSLLGTVCFLSYMLNAGWSTPVMLSNSYVDSLNACLCFDADNNGFAVWPQATGLSVNGTPFPTFVSQYNPTTAGWTLNTNLTQLGQSNFGCSDPKIKLDAQGNGLVVWSRGNNELSNGSIVALSYINGVFAPINNPVLLSQAYAFAPQLAMSSDGDALVAWVIANIDTYSCYIQAAYYKGSTHDWVRDVGGTPIVKTIQDNIQFLDPYLPFPQIAMDENHRALFVWAQLGLDLSGFTSTVWSVSYDGSDWISWAPQGPTSLSVSQGYDPVLAMNAHGDAIVAFASTTTKTYPEAYPFIMQAVRYDGTAQDYVRQSGSIVIKDLEADVIPVSYARPQVAIDSQGNCIVVWDNYMTSSNWYINATRYSSTTSWISWVPSVTTVMQGLVMLPSIVMDSQGNATALWMVNVPPYGALVLQAAAYNAMSDSWGAASYVCNDFDHDINFLTTQDDWPSIVYDNNDIAVATWCQSDGRVVRLNSSRYVPSTRDVSSCKQEKSVKDDVMERRAIQARNHLALILEKTMRMQHDHSMSRLTKLSVNIHKRERV